MKTIIGFVIGVVCIFGGFVLAGGTLGALYQPFEFMIIAGGAAGGFIIANPGTVIRDVLKALPTLLKGPRYKKQDYMDLLSLMYALFTKARKEGLMSLEGDVDEPEQSELFKNYPKVMADHHALDFITDYLRLMVGGSMNPFELENLMDLELETHHQQAHQPGHAVGIAAESLPGFGIVAAVMGVVITMGHMGEAPEVLGHHIAAALVGTFLGVLLCYGFVGPMGQALEHRAKEGSKYLECIKTCILATLNGYTPQIAVEFGRKALPPEVRPGFLELEDHVKQAKK